jgi:modulator of FtsH protease
MQPEMQNQQPVFTGNTDVAVQQNKVLRSTYTLLAVSLIPTIVGAWIGTSVFNIAGLMRGVGPIIASIAVLAIFYGWIYMIEKNKDTSLGLYLLLGFTFFMGLLLGPLLQKVLGFRNGGQLVMVAAGGTAGVFFILSGIASNVKRDFSFLNKFIIVGVIVAMLAVVANIFLQMPALSMALCGVFIILSSAIILWQINSIVRGGETNYISATLTLYVSIYNIFTSLLQMLGIIGGDRD